MDSNDTYVFQRVFELCKRGFHSWVFHNAGHFRASCAWFPQLGFPRDLVTCVPVGKLRNEPECWSRMFSNVLECSFSNFHRKFDLEGGMM